ncbi:MAG: hypothetical protein WAT22_05390 [Saprospiraceae bacterium]|nr:hypothetical protein [Saprospiraceae bacterium]
MSNDEAKLGFNDIYRLYNEDKQVSIGKIIDIEIPERPGSLEVYVFSGFAHPKSLFSSSNIFSDPAPHFFIQSLNNSFCHPLVIP